MIKYLALLLMISCVTKRADHSELHLDVNGKTGNNVVIIPPAERYIIEGIFEKSPYLIGILTCHREQKIYTQTGTFKYYYVPKDLEREGICPLEITGYYVDGSRTVGYIDFAEDLPLAAQVNCNGNEKQYQLGVSVCIGTKGLLQSITFDKQVEPWLVDGCPALNSTDKKHFEFTMESDRCLYVFTNGDQLHRMTTIPRD